ncbi:MAG: hypothetical protein H7839_18660 [Magnetococcus sp. YQC-5]
MNADKAAGEAALGGNGLRRTPPKTRRHFWPPLLHGSWQPGSGGWLFRRRKLSLDGL